jgi:hypothetical protein
MLQSNPWTAGRFLQKDLVFSNTCTETDVDDIITPNVLKNSAVNRNQPYPALVAAVAKNPNMSVQKGKHVQTTAGRIMKLVVVEPETSDGTFAIIFSMSHAAADGADYYRIFNMICGTDPVEVLNPVRVVEFETREPEWIGKKDHGWVGGGGGLIKGMLAGACCGPKANWCCYKVDSAKIGLAKTEAVAKAEKLGAKGVEYVSTNDILTSHFGRACAARVIMMVVNMREKTELNITKNHAGCYETCLLLDAENYIEPSFIRLSLNAGVPYTRQMPSPKLPGYCCTSCPLGFITSWANGAVAGSRFNATNIAGVDTQDLHLPCMDMPDLFDVAIVFKPTPEEYGVIYLAKRASHESLTGADTVLGDVVDLNLFPIKK